eukprot:364585-Chlamydomonas_euryale.AAC.8
MPRSCSLTAARSAAWSPGPPAAGGGAAMRPDPPLSELFLCRKNASSFGQASFTQACRTDRGRGKTETRGLVGRTQALHRLRCDGEGEAARPCGRCRAMPFAGFRGPKVQTVNSV